MKAFISAVLIASALLQSSAPVLAQEDPVESYCTTLGPEDHFASDGVRLRDAAAIIRQDRANYHEFGVRDFSDENDLTFSSRANRARLEAMLSGGSIDRNVRRSIVEGTPDVCIDVYPRYINVFLL